MHVPGVAQRAFWKSNTLLDDSWAKNGGEVGEEHAEVAHEDQIISFNFYRILKWEWKGSLCEGEWTRWEVYVSLTETGRVRIWVYFSRWSGWEQTCVEIMAVSSINAWFIDKQRIWIDASAASDAASSTSRRPSSVIFPLTRARHW